MPATHNDTICAIATGTSRAGIGIVRVSGSQTLSVGEKILGFKPNPRYAHSCNFYADNGSIIDNGLAIFFEKPSSYTGEDVLELQGHGGIQILSAVLERVLSLNVRQANPGEFTERAFLNGKIDLLQAEAIADLIDASSKELARSAARSLQGEFSARIEELQEQLTVTRVNVEASIDFYDDDINIISETRLRAALNNTIEDLDRVFQQANQGIILKDGILVVIAGEPNVGKSSLLNTLAGLDSAIVTDIPGTTRDVLKAEVSIDGIPFHLSDTAGLRESIDPVEQEGINRAKSAIAHADQILLLVDATTLNQQDTDGLQPILKAYVSDLSLTPQSLTNLTLIINKIDLSKDPNPGLSKILIDKKNIPVIRLSAKTKIGIDVLKSHLKNISGYKTLASGSYSARHRHLLALTKAKELLISANEKASKHLHLELVAEDLRLAQQSLGNITGEFSTDDLLEEIFSSFCVGK